MAPAHIHPVIWVHTLTFPSHHKMKQNKIERKTVICQKTKRKSPNGQRKQKMLIWNGGNLW